MLRIFFDVDDTIVIWEGSEPRLRPGVREIFTRLCADGHEIYLWSGNGIRWEIVEQFSLTDLVVNCFLKPKYNHRQRLAELSVPFVPDFVIDDYQEVVDAFVGVRITPPLIPLEEDLALFRIYEVIKEHTSSKTVSGADKMGDMNRSNDVIQGEHYDASLISAVERKWRQHWSDEKVFSTPDPKPGEKTFYCLDMFPYPSGDGLHVGHPVGYIASDILARYKRMRGFNVLHPMGWDAFGLPAERHAMKTGEHPAETVRRNAANYKKQMDLIGLSFDWDRSFSTTDPSYYRWTQMMFLRLYDSWFDTKEQKAKPIAELPLPESFANASAQDIEKYRDKHRLVYFDNAVVNFCPELGTVVANEEVMADGRTEQGYEVIRRPLTQVIMRISAFAERLLAGLDSLDWPEAIKDQQRTWIGRSVGVNIRFSLEGDDDILNVFTTHPETIFGVTFLALAPEHPIISKITQSDYQKEVDAYVHSSIQRGELARKQQDEKTGVLTGSYAINPVNGERVPVYVSDYVLMETGTGAVMGVPAHDERDFLFAKKYSLEVSPVFAPDEEPERSEVIAGKRFWAGSGTALPIESEVFRTMNLRGLNRADYAAQVVSYLEAIGAGEKSIQYRIRDWIFARQRYWGDPIPLIHWEDGSTTTVPESELPLELPILKDYSADESGEPPLSKATAWKTVIDPETGKTGQRELSTMPQWAGSCWYPLRFMDPKNEAYPVDPEKERMWGPVDFYIGGAEHATLHLLYARFWYLALSDLGVIKTVEPFLKLVNQGLLSAFAYKTQRGVLVPIDEIEKRADGNYYVMSSSSHYDPATSNEPLERVKAKMSKSLRNVVNPDSVVAAHGADSFRVCLMFMGPVEGVREWEDEKVIGAKRFLSRFWQFVVGKSLSGIRETVGEADEDSDVRRIVDLTIQSAQEGIESLRLNTTISAFMKCLNDIGARPVSKPTLEKLVLSFSPFAPFLCEELWQRLGHLKSLAREPWPNINLDLINAISNIKIVLTVNGRKKSVIEADAAIDDATLNALVREELKAIGNSPSSDAKFIVVRDRKSGLPTLVNIVEKK